MTESLFICRSLDSGSQTLLDKLKGLLKSQNIRFGEISIKKILLHVSAQIEFFDSSVDSVDGKKKLFE